MQSLGLVLVTLWPEEFIYGLCFDLTFFLTAQLGAEQKYLCNGAPCKDCSIKPKGKHSISCSLPFLGMVALIFLF